MKGASYKIGIDIDGTITYAPEFFKMLTQALRTSAEIHIVTARTDPQDPKFHEIVEASLEELNALGIYCDIFAAVGARNKVKYVTEEKISVMFDDVDEEICEMPESCKVFKIREDMNFCWDTNRWLHSEKTSLDIREHIANASGHVKED